MAETRMTWTLIGRDVSASKSIQGVGQAAQSTSGKLKGFASSAAGMFTAIGAAAAAAGIGKYAVEAVGAASDLNETLSKSGVVFGSASGEIQKWSQTAATSLGQSQQAALDAASNFGVFGKAAGLSGTDLAKFSTGLTTTAADMASFSNTTPQEAVDALGAALRGESEPIRKYGVLLSQSALDAKAFQMGLVKGNVDAAKVGAGRAALMKAQENLNKVMRDGKATEGDRAKAQAAVATAEGRLSKALAGKIPPLTQQQKIMASQALIYEQLGTKGSGAMGDFARTSGGLANQQRILSAQMANVKTTIGTALLPAATTLVTAFTTSVLPAFQKLADEYAPKLADVLAGLAPKVAGFAAGLASYDWSGLGDDIAAVFDGLKTAGPALKDASASAPSFSDSLKVGGAVVGFMADHVDILVKALPLLAAGFVIVKSAQAASNAMDVVRVPLLIAQVVATRQLAAANRQLASSQGAVTKAQGLGFIATIRQTAAMLAQRVAQLAARTASILYAAAQWLVNAAMAANPIGLIIIAIVALVAAIVLAYQNSETFRNIVQAAWAGIQAAVAAVVDWFMTYVWPLIRLAINLIAAYYRFLWRIVVTVFNAIKAAIGVVINWFGSTVVPVIRAHMAAVGAVFQALKGVATTVWNGIVTAVSGAYSTLSGWVGKITGLFSGVASTISGAFSGVADGIVGALRSAWNSIVSAWNGAIGGKSFSIPGIASFSVPSLTPMATGGIVTRATAALIGEAGPEAIIPLSRAREFGLGRSGGAVIHVNVTAGAVGSKEQLARTVIDALQDAQRRGMRLGIA